MFVVSTAQVRSFCGTLAALFIALSCLLIDTAPAIAKVQFSAISVDARTGKILSAVDPDGLRHPASLTKVMTLYLLFEDLKAGKLKLSSSLRMSARAASMAPSKLGVKAGKSITVETAIKAIAVKSANDVATAVAENLAGTESAFAARMTSTARALGMSRTVFRNASGLPNPAQVTTARDMATLSLRIQRDFPQYYPYFRTSSFTYRGRTIRTHNRLLGRYKGTDGIKTGYIASAGFNLTSSAIRDGKRVVGVVLGARSNSARNAYMVRMLDKAFPHCVPGRTIAARPGSSAGAADPPSGQEAAAPESSPKKSLIPLLSSEDKAAAQPETQDDSNGAASADEDTPGNEVQTASNSKIPQVLEAKIDEPGLPQNLPFEVKPEANQQEADSAVIASMAAEGWNVQIGSYPEKKDALLRLEKLRDFGLKELQDKPAFTVTVQKGNEISYRARYSGFTEKSARETCHEIERRNISCQVVAPNS